MIRALLISAALLASAPASAVIVSVAGTAQPWNWVAGGLNDAYQYGINDGSGPTVVSFASAGISSGGSWGVFAGLGGLTSAFGGTPTVDRNGYVGSFFKDDVLGSSGTYFPSHFTPSLWSADPGAGVFLNALVFVFTDATGQIVDTPNAFNVIYDVFNSSYGYVIGISGSPAPFGATQIQLGFNDDIFADNTGALDVCVYDGTPAGDRSCFSSPTPEPESWALMLTGFAVVGLAVRRRRHGFASA